MIKQLWRALATSWPLVIIIGIYLLLVALFSWMTPPFEGPDEPQHFAYVEWLVEHDTFPPQGRDSWETPVQQESSQPPLYYFLASLPARLVRIDSPRAQFRPNPYAVLDFALAYPDNDNRAIHYPQDTSPPRGGWLALYLSRGITSAFGLLLIVAVYGLARAAVPEQKGVAYAAAFLVATLPQVVYLSGLVSNDIPVAAVSTFLLWLLVLLLRGSDSRLLLLTIGVVYGLAALIKASALVLFVPIALSLLWLLFSSRRRTPLRVMGSGLLIAGGALLSAGWWYLRSAILYGSVLGLETHDQAPWAIVDPLLLSTLSFRWLEVFRSFWLFLGWGSIKPSDEYYYIFAVFVILALAGLLLLLFRLWKTRKLRLDQTAAIFVVLSSAILTNFIFLEIWMRRVLAPYGRLLYPALSAIILLLVLGWRSLHPRLPAVPLAVTLITSLLAPFLLLRPAFALPEFLDPDQIAAKSNLNWTMGETASAPLVALMSVTPLQETMKAGDLLPVELCWQAQAPSEQDYSILVHIVGPGNSVLASRRTFPGLGRYPTTLWHKGDAWCDLLHVWVDGDNVTRTLVYEIEVAMLDTETGDRLPIYDSRGEEVTAGFAADVLIRATQDVPAAEGAEQGTIALQSYELQERWQRGESNPFTLVWSTTAPLTADFQLFVHLRDPNSGETVAQADGPPLNGWYPTSRWIPGTAITDERTFPLPADIEPGLYELVIGFYDLDSGQRFGEEVSLGTIEVQP